MGSAVLVGVFSSLEINGHACRQQDAGLAGKSTCSSSDLCPLPTHFKASSGMQGGKAGVKGMHDSLETILSLSCYLASL